MDILVLGPVRDLASTCCSATPGCCRFGHAAFWGGSAYCTGLIAIHCGRAVPGRRARRRASFAMLLAVPDRLPRRCGAPASTSPWSRWRSRRWSTSSPTSGATSPAARTACRACRANLLRHRPVETDPFYFYYAALPIVAARHAASPGAIVHSPFGRVLVGDPRQPGPGPGARLPRRPLQDHRRSSSRPASPAWPAALFAISHGFASLQELHWTTSGKVVLITVLGGIGTLWGGLVGAGVVVPLED